MKRFNPEKELYKIQHGNKNKIIFGVFLLLIIIGISSSYALYQVRYSKRIIYTKVAPFSTKDLDLAVYINGEKQSKVPEKNSGYKLLTMICDTEYVGNTIWDDSKALLSLPPMPIPNKCNVYLISNDYEGTKTFEYSGDAQEYIVAKDGLYKIELWGAGGGMPANKYGLNGLGGYTSGLVELKEGETLYFYVGEKGKMGIKGKGKTAGVSFNGGGEGVGSNDGDDGGGSGGGATDVRLEKGTAWNDFNSLKSRIMVAGGGSGGPTISAALRNCSGGGLTGVGNSYYYGANSQGTSLNATQTSGYKFGIGENGVAGSAGGSGGGGGYYGGLSDNVNSQHGGGGGGSSFISGHSGCNAISGVSTVNKIEHTGLPNHYSNKVFTHTLMVDGEGYYWTDTRQTYIGMPTFDGTSIMQGNDENGYARITYLGPA